VQVSRPIDPNDPYIGWRPRLAEPELRAGSAALLVIDMQYGDAHVDYGILRWRREHGYTNCLDYVARRLEQIVPNIQRLQQACRRAGIEVMFTRIQSMTRDGRDRSLSHRELGHHFAPGSREAQMLDELAPLEDELVFDKTTGSVFNSTNIHYVLRNMGIETLIMVGVMTGGCVESAARDAKDLGYHVLVVEDACGTWTGELQAAAIRVMDEVFGKVKTTDEVLEAIVADD